MGFRSVYGNTISENGWPMVDANSCAWVTVPGSSVSLQIQQGQPLQILRAFAADFNAFVEPLRDADSACWTPTNSVATSNHLSGTAMDLNWNSHPFRILNAGFTSEQINTVRDLLEWYEDTIFWGNDWNTPKDAMHFQLGYSTHQNQHTQDFINRKIRADGYSTFRRGGTVTPAPANDAATVLARATGLSVARATEILPAVTAGLQASNCTNPNRIAMWLAQIGHESGSFQYTEEIAKNGRYAPYIGRTWIQITWKSNYQSFNMWCYENGLVDSTTYFVTNPERLADLKWAGLGAAWYWTVARPQINALSDAGDLLAVTKAINGGTNGLADRQERYDRAKSVGSSLLALITDQTPAADEWEQLMAIEVESLSIYATPGEPRIPVERLIQALDAHGSHEGYVEAQALLGDADALSRIARTAAGKGKYGSAAFAVNQARAALAKVEASNPDLLRNYLKGA